jgi:hypothetical protein
VRVKSRPGYTVEQIEAIIARLKQGVQQPDSIAVQNLHRARTPR